MFRDGQYLEVIKASDDCLATVVVTVQEKTVEIRRRKVTTNKWLQVEDWAALYKILERAVLRNGRQHGDGSHRESRRRERRKSTRQLEVTYTYEPPECTSDATSLPTIKVHVSPAKKRSVKRETDNETSKRIDVGAEVDDAPKLTKGEKFPDRTNGARDDRLKKAFEDSTQISSEKCADKCLPDAAAIAAQESPKKRKSRKYTLCDNLENAPLEEYIPDTPKAKRSCPEFKYVPSRKSALESMRLTSNEYTPTLCNSESVADVTTTCYVPNSIEKLAVTYETYEPHATTTIPDGILEEYVPNSKGIQSSVEEYEPDFKSQSKPMKFDDSYVPSSVRQDSPNESKTTPLSSQDKLKMRRREARRTELLINKKMEELFS